MDESPLYHFIHSCFLHYHCSLKQCAQIFWLPTLASFTKPLLARWNFTRPNKDSLVGYAGALEFPFNNFENSGKSEKPPQ